MTTDETIKLVLQLTGSETLQEANTKLHALHAEMDATKDASQALATQTTSTASAHGDLGRGILQTSYAVQDFTSVLAGGGGLSRALGSVQNNIPVLLSGLGMGPGMAGMISLVSVGLGAAIPLIMSLGDETAKAGDKAKDGAEKLTGWNDQLERLVEAGKKLREAQTKPEEDTEKAVTEALKLAGGKVVGAGYERHLMEQDTAAEEGEFRRRMATPEIQAEMQFGGPQLREALFKRVRGEIRGEAQATRRARVEAFMGSLPGSAANRQALVQMARARPDQFGQETAQLLEDAEPEARAAADRELEEAEAFGERAHAGGVGRRRIAAEYNQRRALMERNLDKATNEAIDNEESLEHQQKQEAAQAAHQAALDLREQQKADREAPLHKAEAFIRSTAGNMGEPLTQAQITDAAKEALRAVGQGIGASDAAYGAISSVVNQANRLRDQLMMQGHRWEQLRQISENGQVWSDSRQGQN